ncbi:MAG: transposase [Bacteroidales bacterium]|nr:transposase [Bacteroidales bacterium]
MSKIFKEALSSEKLEELTGSDEKCLEFLAELKWSEGYTCRKCGNTNYCSGKTPFSRRCTKCKTEESATTGTIFHNCKFLSARLFILPIMYVRVRKKYPPMNLPGVCRCGR